MIHTPLGWFCEVATPFQMERWGSPTIRGEVRECYAITEEGRGSDVDAIAGDRSSRRRRLRAERRQVARHVGNLSSFVLFQAKLTEGPHAGEHAMFVMDLRHAGHHACVRTPAYSHTFAPPPLGVEFADVRVPAANLIGDEGDGMTFAHEWFRYERLMIAARCCGAMERLIDEATAFAKDRQASAARSSSTR